MIVGIRTELRRTEDELSQLREQKAEETTKRMLAENSAVDLKEEILDWKRQIEVLGADLPTVNKELKAAREAQSAEERAHGAIKSRHDAIMHTTTRRVETALEIQLAERVKQAETEAGAVQKSLGSLQEKEESHGREAVSEVEKLSERLLESTMENDAIKESFRLADKISREESGVAQQQLPRQTM